MKTINHTKTGSGATDLIVELFKLNGALIKFGDQLVKPLGLTSARWQILGALALAEKPLTVPQVARSMGLSRQAVQRISNDLNKKGWVGFKDLPSDKRTRLLTLTAKGQKVYRQASQKQVSWVNELCSGLTAAEINAATKVLFRLGENCGN